MNPLKLWTSLECLGYQGRHYAISKEMTFKAFDVDSAHHYNSLIYFDFFSISNIWAKVNLFCFKFMLQIIWAPYVFVIYFIYSVLLLTLITKCIPFSCIKYIVLCNEVAWSYLPVNGRTGTGKPHLILETMALTCVLSFTTAVWNNEWVKW